ETTGRLRRGSRTVPQLDRRVGRRVPYSGEAVRGPAPRMERYNPGRAAKPPLPRTPAARPRSPVVRVPLAAEDRLEALVQGLALADQVSLFLAEHRKIDPFPYDAITRFKAALEPPASRPRLRPSTSST